MQSLVKISQGRIAKTVGLAMILALVVTATAVTIAQTNNFTVKIYEGDPAQNKVLPGIPVRIVPDDGSAAKSGSSNSSGEVSFALNEGGYTIEIAHNISSHYSRDYHAWVDSDTTLQASILPKQTSPTPTPTPNPPPAPGHKFTVRVFEGDPAQKILLPNINVKVVPDSGSNPFSGATNSAGTVVFNNVSTGGYNVEIGHNISTHYGRDYHTWIDSETELQASLISKTPSPNPPPPGSGCLPTPPRGKPLLNIWPISESGAPCTDYSLLAAKNVSTNSGYVTGNGTVTATSGQIIQVQMYVHNGVLDYPENIARNVMVKSSVPAASGTITAEAWADNADRITSAQKGGNVNIALGSNQFLEYVPGSTKLFDANGAFQTKLSDGITGSGVSIGDMRGCFEFRHFVNFQLVVKTKQVPPPPTPTPSLEIQKTVRNATAGSAFADSVNAKPGDQVEFKIVVSASKATAKDVAVADALPARLVFVPGSISVDGSSTGFGLGRITLGNMTAGLSKTIFFRANVAAASEFPVGTTVLVNKATASASNAASVSDTANVAVKKEAPATPVLSIQKTVRNATAAQSTFADSVNAKPGDQVEFKIVVSASAATASKVVVADALPSRLNFVNGSISVDGHSTNFGISNIALGDIANGMSKTIHFRANVAAASEFPVGTTVLVNKATASASNAASVSDTANVAVKKEIIPPTETTLTIDKTVANRTKTIGYQETVSADFGDRLSFRLVVKNTGSIAALNVVIRDILPESVPFDGNLLVSVSSSGNPVSSPYLQIGTLPSGGLVTVTFDALMQNPNCGRFLTNFGFASASNAGQVSDTANVNTPACVPGNPNLVLSKIAWNDTQNKNASTVTAKPGEFITYTLTVKNIGNAVASNFIFTDDVSDIIKLANLVDIDGATLVGGKLVYPATDIPAGATVNRAFRVQVKNPVPSGSDCTMTNTYGNTVNVKVSCAFVAPPTGSTSNISMILAALTLLGFAGYRTGKLQHLARLMGLAKS